MRPTQHPSNTRVLGAPKKWDQKNLPCSAIAVTDCEIGRIQCIQTFWRPDVQELAELNAGGLIVLSFIGQTLPPVSVDVVT